MEAKIVEEYALIAILEAITLYYEMEEKNGSCNQVE